MKPTERVLDVDSTLRGENVRMGIDQSALQHIISVLTDLYSDPELAVIREYSTNALDAHRAAGNPLPIEVTTPTPLSPFFRVRDYGDGLDVEDIRSIYSQYGTSTKRDSNDVVGMLGLGCKSALTYTDQFTLVGTKDGRTVQVSIHRDEDGGGSMTIVSDEATPDAPSGVEVIVPTRRDSKFEQKARTFFQYWTKGSVLLNGGEPQSILDSDRLVWLQPGKLAVLSAENRYSAEPGWVVMGNVAYPIPDDGKSSGRRYQTLAFVDIGEVNFTPSREALMLTKTTKATLDRIKADVERELVGAMQKKVATAATPNDAVRLMQEANVYGVKTSDLTYQGKPIPTALERGNLGPATNNNTFLVVSLNGRYARKSGDRVRQLVPFATGRIVFTGFAAQDFSTAKRQKFEAWLAQEGIDMPQQIVCVESLTPDEAYWLRGVPTYDWAPVQAIKVAKSGTVGPSWKARPTGSYEKEGGGHIEAGDIDLTKPLLWIRPDERHDPYASRWRTPPKIDFPAEATVLVMPANRLAKFERDFPHAMHWRDYFQKEATDWLDQQDAAALDAAKYQISGAGRGLTGLDPARITDADLVKWVTLQNTNVAAVKTGIERRQKYLVGFDRSTLESKYPNPLKKYPLADNSHAEHTYLYINAVIFAASQKENA